MVRDLESSDFVLDFIQLLGEVPLLFGNNNIANNLLNVGDEGRLTNTEDRLGKVDGEVGGFMDVYGSISKGMKSCNNVGYNNSKVICIASKAERSASWRR